MGGIRPFREADIPQVTALHCDAFGNPRPRSPDESDEYRRWLTSVFLDNPMRTDGLGSVVCEEDGQIIGFLGIIPRTLKLGGRSYRGSMCSNFCVHPARRGGVGARLLTHYRNMPHDVAFVDEVLDRAAALFERCGWRVSGLQSIRWILPLRPLERMLSTLRLRLPAPLLAAGRPAARSLDAALRLVPSSPFRVTGSARRLRVLQPGELAKLLEEFGEPGDLRPVTGDGSTDWLVERARGMAGLGELHGIALDDADGRVAGWFLYYATVAGQGEVLQLVARRDAAAEVLTALAHHAFERGVVSLSGTLHPSFLPALASRRALFDSASGTRWMLVHTPHAEIMEAFWRGNLLLSRMDGEWCQHLR